MALHIRSFVFIIKLKENNSRDINKNSRQMLTQFIERDKKNYLGFKEIIKGNNNKNITDITNKESR